MTDVNYSGKIEWPEFAVALAEKLKPDEDDEVSFIIKSMFMKGKDSVHHVNQTSTSKVLSLYILQIFYRDIQLYRASLHVM